MGHWHDAVDDVVADRVVVVLALWSVVVATII